MVQAMIQISKNTNQILNVVKAKYNLKDKSQAIEKVVKKNFYLESKKKRSVMARINPLPGEKHVYRVFME